MYKRQDWGADLVGWPHNCSRRHDLWTFVTSCAHLPIVFFVIMVSDGKLRNHIKQKTRNCTSIRERKKVSGIIICFNRISLETKIESLTEKG